MKTPLRVAYAVGVEFTIPGGTERPWPTILCSAKTTYLLKILDMLKTLAPLRCPKGVWFPGVYAGN